MNRTRTFAASILLSFGLALGLCLVPGEARAAEPVPVSVTATPAHGQSEEDAEIAALEAREAASPELQKFEGGDAVYISSGAIILVLVIVLIIIII